MFIFFRYEFGDVVFVRWNFLIGRRLYCWNYKRCKQLDRERMLKYKYYSR